MAKTPAQNHDKTAQRLNKNPLTVIKWVLLHIGKPIYLLIYGLIYVLIASFNIVKTRGLRVKSKSSKIIREIKNRISAIRGSRENLQTLRAQNPMRALRRKMQPRMERIKLGSSQIISAIELLISVISGIGENLQTLKVLNPLSSLRKLQSALKDNLKIQKVRIKIASHKLVRAVKSSSEISVVLKSQIAHVKSGVLKFINEFKERTSAIRVINNKLHKLKWSVTFYKKTKIKKKSGLIYPPPYSKKNLLSNLNNLRLKIKEPLYKINIFVSERLSSLHGYLVSLYKRHKDDSKNFISSLTNLLIGKQFHFKTLNFLSSTKKFIKIKFVDAVNTGKKFYNKLNKRLKNLNVTSVKLLRSTREILQSIVSVPVNNISILRSEEVKIHKTALKVGVPRIRKLKIKLKRPRLTLGLALFSFISTSMFLASTIFVNEITKELPSPDKLSNRRVEVSTKIYDRNGILLYTIYKDKNRSIVRLDNVPQHVILATLAAEDAEFYDHPGFSIKGITRALYKIVFEGEITGGSTITQQLVKNTLLTPERTIQRKIKEIILAVRVERRFTKDQILEMYLNEVSYGGTAYGIQEASRQYFDKDVDQLTLAEAALIAGLPKSPTKYSPFGSNPKLAKARQKEVLWLMQVNGYVPQRQRTKAEQEELKFADSSTDIKAPHFVMYVRSLLEDKYGEDLVGKGGLEVVTSLDYEVQVLAEKFVAEEIKNLEDLNVTNASMVLMDPQTGELLAMVGSKDYFDFENDGNVNVATSLRQPGSSIKLINYAYALSNDYTASTIINDSPITFEVEGQKPYSPKNYDGRFRGPVTLRNAFAESRNIPAVKVLASYGTTNMIKMGRKMGITTWNDPANYGLSLTLGGGDIKLLDLAQAYATVANYGKKPNLKPILKITDYSGKVVENNKCDKKIIDKPVKLVQEIKGQTLQSTTSSTIESSLNLIKNACRQEKVLDERVSFILTDILRDNQARSPAFGNNSQLVIPSHPEVAVKTGTSNNLRDNLTIGYNKDYLVAVWVGNNDNSPMSRVASGLTGASSIWNKIMTAILTKDDKEKTSINPAAVNTTSEREKYWEVPEGLIQLPICPYTGTLACSGCPVQMEWFKEEDKPEIACNPSWFKKSDDEEDEREADENLQDGNNTEIIYYNESEVENIRVRNNYLR